MKYGNINQSPRASACHESAFAFAHLRDAHFLQAAPQPLVEAPPPPSATDVRGKRKRTDNRKINLSIFFLYTNLLKNQIVAERWKTNTSQQLGTTARVYRHSTTRESDSPGRWRGSSPAPHRTSAREGAPPCTRPFGGGGESRVDSR